MGEIAAQTRSSWARRIRSYAAVPPAYRSFFEPLQAQGQPFPYTVLSPSPRGFLHRPTQKLICQLDHDIHVLERSGSRFIAHRFPLTGITYVEVREVLLDSHIIICGVTAEGIPTTCTIKFNTVTDYLFRPVVQRIRLGAGEAADTPDGPERDKFDHLIGVNYKFMNYARRSLLPGEKVVRSILQPEIRDRLLTAFGKTFYRTVSPTHMAILTDREVIMITEELRRSAEGKYGGTWTYIQLNKVVALSQSERGTGLLGLSFHLPAAADLEVLFEASMKQEVEALLVRFRELTA